MFRVENNIFITDQTPEDKCEDGAGIFFFKFMKKHGGNIAQIDISTGKQDTYNTLLQKCIRTAITLQKMGIEKDDMITFCSKTNLNSCVPLVASFLLGAIPSYVDATLSPFEVAHYINRINPKLFLMTPDAKETIYDLVQKEHPNTNVAVFNEEFLQPQESESEFTPCREQDIQRTAMIYFSSGSTGFPKPICINHYRIVSCGINSMEIFWMENEPKVFLSYDSFHWIVETHRFIVAARIGSCRLICSGEADMKKAWSHIEKYKVNTAYLAPAFLIDMAESGTGEVQDLTSLTTIFIEGSKLPKKYYEKLQKLVPKIDIFQWYGQTETGELLSFTKSDFHRELMRKKPESVGMIITNSGLCLKVVDIITRETLGPNKKGELCVKSRGNMNGYYNLDSSDQFDKDGWLKTGDVVYYDDDYCFYIVDRIKDLIIFQGWHVVPAQIETVLLSHSAVKHAVVVGIPDEKDHQHPLALVSLHDNFDTVSPSELEKYVEERVPNKYRLRGGVKVIDESYLKTGNKIKRLKLKQLVLSGEI